MSFRIFDARYPKALGVLGEQLLSIERSVLAVTTTTLVIR